MDYKFTSYSDVDTTELAENMESEKFPNMVICLEGELGSGKAFEFYARVFGGGKTVFVKGFAKALGIEDNITSPTFNLIKEYLNGEMPLYHMDMYRLEGNVENIGVEDYFNKNGVCIIEWSDMIEDILPEERLVIKFKIINENKRVLVIKPYGEKYEKLCDSVL